MVNPPESSARYEIPERPAVETVLPPLPQIQRPKVVMAVPVLVVLSVLASVPSLVLSWRHDADVRHGLQQQLARKAKDYTTSDVHAAVLVGVILVLALCIIFSMAEIRASLRLLNKKGSARLVLLWLTIFHLPLIAFAPQVRDIGQWDEVAAWIQGGSLCLAVACAFWYQVGRWLTAVTRQGPIPLRPSNRG